MARFKVTGITNAEEKVFIEEYNKWLKEITWNLVEYRDAMLEVMSKTDLKAFNKEEDFRDMAKSAIFHKIDVIYKQEALIEETEKLISNGGFKST